MWWWWLLYRGLISNGWCSLGDGYSWYIFFRCELKVVGSEGRQWHKSWVLNKHQDDPSRYYQLTEMDEDNQAVSVAEHDREGGKLVDVEPVIDLLFKDLDYTNGNGDNIDQYHIYPELILQKAEHANKYYSSFQSHTKQFIPEDSLSSHTKILRWSDSTIEQTRKLILDHWGRDRGTKKDDNRHTSVSTKGSSRHNALFSWSSSDAYIQARKKELRRRKGDPNGTKEHDSSGGKKHNSSRSMNRNGSPDEEHSNAADLQEKLNIKFPPTSINNKLNRIIETESHKFVHSRIQQMRKHHSDEMSKQIHERKRRDHEEYLRKLKLKEEEYEKSIQAAMEANQNKTGFFGSLFGFNSTPSASSHGSSLRVNEIDSSVRGSNESLHTIDSNSVAQSSKSKNRFSLFGVFGSASPKKDQSRSVLFEKESSIDGDVVSTRNKLSEDKGDAEAQVNEQAPEIIITSTELDRQFSLSTSEPTGKTEEENASENEYSSTRVDDLHIVESPKVSHQFFSLDDSKVVQAKNEEEDDDDLFDVFQSNDRKSNTKEGTLLDL